MAYGIKMMAWGDYACWTRPEMKVERVSYDVITPSGARGVLEAIYWKPAIRWVVNRIHVLAPIRRTSIRRNEVASPGDSGHKVPMGKVKSAMNGNPEPISIAIEENRQQRASLILTGVRYGIEAEFEIKDGSEPGKHLDQFNRRLKSGQCWQRPYLGCREFAADFAPVEGDFPPCPEELRGVRELGFMLHDIDFDAALTPRFYNARMVDGVIDVRQCLAETKALF